MQSSSFVEIHSTSNSEYDGRKGMITGRLSVLPGMTVYLVDLEEPILYEDGFVARTIAMTEHCLRDISYTLILPPEEWPEHHS